MKSAALRRYTPLRSRGRSRFPGRRDPEFMAWFREMCGIRYYNCKVCGERAEPHHVVSVGAGGDDIGNVVPLCRPCHREVHDNGREWFERIRDVDLMALAFEVSEDYGGGTFPFADFPEDVA